MEKKKSVIDRLEHAFNKAEQHLGIERLLDPEGNTHTHGCHHITFHAFHSCTLIGPVKHDLSLGIAMATTEVTLDEALTSDAESD